MHPVTTVPAGQSPRRLDVFVSTQSAHLSRALAQRLIDRGLITVNGRAAKCALRIRPGDVITCHVPPRESPPVGPEPIPIEVLHEDDALLIVNKPAGLVMHPAPGHWCGTLLNALVHHVGPGEGSAPDAADDRRARPGLVHRLDKGTSGVIVVAKTDAAHRELSRQFRVHSIHRIYLALVAGAVERGGRVDQALGRDPRDRRRVSVRSVTARRAVTEFRVAERLGPGATLLEVRPQTGRMHQIRVHLASIGHAVLGDPTYGESSERGLTRPMLHAAVLGFVHPTTGRYAEFEAPLPRDMHAALARHRANAGG